MTREAQRPAAPAASTNRIICDTNDSDELAERGESRAMRVAAALAAGERAPRGILERWWHQVATALPGEVRELVVRRYATRADDIDRCGASHWLRTLDGAADRWQPSRCRDRMCARCWGMAAARRERDVAAMIDVAREHGARLAFITLTLAVPGWEGGRRRAPDPRAAVDQVLEAWRMLRQRSRRDAVIMGGWRRLEVTWRRPRRAKSGRAERVRAHAHLHCVVLVAGDASVAEVRDATVGRWIAAVAELGGRAIDQAQDVDRVDNEAQTRRYLLKYLQKVDEYHAEPAIAGLAAHTLRARQLVAPFGCAHGSSAHPLAPELGDVRAAARAERARYGAATIGGAVGVDMRACTAADRVLRAGCRARQTGMPSDPGADAEARQVLEQVRGARRDWADVITDGLRLAPDWQRRQAERSDLAASRLRLTPTMLAALADDGAPQAIAWISQIELARSDQIGQSG